MVQDGGKGKSGVQKPVVWNPAAQKWVPAPKPKGAPSKKPGEAGAVVVIGRAHEGFATSALPTLRSQEDLEAYQRKLLAGKVAPAR